VFWLTRIARKEFFEEGRAWLVLVVPCVGILGSVLITRWLLGGELGRGLPTLLREVRERAGVVPSPQAVVAGGHEHPPPWAPADRLDWRLRSPPQERPWAATWRAG
jgi:hypothetical protein